MKNTDNNTKVVLDSFLAAVFLVFGLFLSLANAAHFVFVEKDWLIGIIFIFLTTLGFVFCLALLPSFVKRMRDFVEN